ncbi:multiheme c-type cytochrome [Rhodopirellula sp. MGV]|uniref:multiheme c-type cytochrome n=1 Tax=Rhodopirellula sp. MGV TaxID=2023130 RepID=UPI000B96CFBF|nr:multiheme c-type cytochrome [Rhodopirellula sp. MGV]OYP32971.1 hypothetical protein CGZ80_18905 [Rhodopirellula sp. MGV]PNY35372.1 hypothetical protein C2E31_17805 [Rhodopirellula baltica]
MKTSLLWKLLAIGFAAILVYALVFSESSPQVVKIASVKSKLPEPAATTPPPIEAVPTVARTSGYVGSQACLECHREYHQSWHESYHRTMTQVVSPDAVPAPIVDGGSVVSEGAKFDFVRQGDEYFVELADPIANGKRMKRKLVLTTGSHHMQVFWYESGYDGTPAQLPIVYYIDAQRWIPRKSAFLRHPDMAKGPEFSRWNAICSNCHATQVRTRPPARGDVAWDTRVAEFGISCEACHGPGENHIQCHDSSLAATSLSLSIGDTVDPIVNPAKLPAELRSDMCGQCHGMMMISIADADQQEQYFKDGRQFRPGDSLNDAPFLRLVRATEEHRTGETFKLFDAHSGFTQNHFWSDGEIRVTGRDYSGMIESPCFKNGELSCFSCHTMHEQDLSRQNTWKDDQLKPQMRGDDACIQCHPKYKELGIEHTHHPIDSAGSRCMNCHMPHTVYGLLKTSRSHTITSPSVKSTLETGRPNACNLCHLDHTLGETATNLTDWYGHDLPQLTSDQKNIASGVLQFMIGDAAQRALQVNAFQWQPAQEASGTKWMPLFFLLGMDDEYHAIRLMAERGFNSLPHTKNFDYDFLESLESRGAIMGEQYQRALDQSHEPDAALLIGTDGLFDREKMADLMQKRDSRPVNLQE